VLQNIMVISDMVELVNSYYIYSYYNISLKFKQYILNFCESKYFCAIIHLKYWCNHVIDEYILLISGNIIFFLALPLGSWVWHNTNNLKMSDSFKNKLRDAEISGYREKKA